MPKVLPSGKTEFELTESFWKTYKPDSVDGKELTKKLKTFEERLDTAQKSEKLDDEDETDTKVLQKKMEAWAVVVTGLNDIKTEMEKVLKSLTKEKESHENLRESMERTCTQLKRGAHVVYMSANQKQEKYLELIRDADTEKDSHVSGEENEEFDEWLKKIDKTEVRNWSQAGRQFQSLVTQENIEIAGEINLAINNVFFAVSGWKRSGVFEKLSTPKNFHRNIDRQIKALIASTKDIIQGVTELMPLCKTNAKLGGFLAQFMKDIAGEKAFWQKVKKECPLEDK